MVTTVTSSSEVLMYGWRAAWPLVFLFMLTACYPEYEPEAHGMGDALAHNFVEQVVRPEPNTIAAPPSLDGWRAVGAYERYQADRVIQPSDVTTSQVGGAAPTTGASAGGAAAVGTGTQ